MSLPVTIVLIACFTPLDCTPSSLFFIVTNEDGYYSFVMTSNLIRGPHNLTITPFKKTGNVTHTFEYNAVPITNRTLYIDTLTFDQEVNIIDTAAVNYVGMVSIANTAPFNGINGGPPCAISNVTVCIRNYIGGELFACTNTDNDGA